MVAMILAAVLGALVLVLAGAVGAAFAVYRMIWLRTFSGRPVQVTLPGSHPNESVTYHIDPRGTWHRLTPKIGKRRR